MIRPQNVPTGDLTESIYRSGNLRTSSSRAFAFDFTASLRTLLNQDLTTNPFVAHDSLRLKFPPGQFHQSINRPGKSIFYRFHLPGNIQVELSTILIGEISNPMFEICLPPILGNRPYKRPYNQRFSRCRKSRISSKKVLNFQQPARLGLLANR